VRRTHGEVDGEEARQLAVGVDTAAADGRRQVVGFADVLTFAVVLARPERTRLEPRVGPEEVASHELQLVVRVVGEEMGRVVEVDAVGAALLEGYHRTT